MNSELDRGSRRLEVVQLSKIFITQNHVHKTGIPKIILCVKIEREGWVDKSCMKKQNSGDDPVQKLIAININIQSHQSFIQMTLLQKINASINKKYWV